MRAVRFYEHGGPEVLKLENDVPVPVPGPGEVLVKIEAAGINYADVVRRRGGHYPVPTPLPHISGAEIVGPIEAVGAGVAPQLIGQRVFGAPNGGGYAEYIALPHELTFPFPDGIEPVAGVALFIQGLTAALVLKAAGKLRSGDSVFIEGAAGGVGSLAVQLAKCYGAGKVIAGASSDAKRAIALSLGADAAIDYTKPGWGQELKALTDGRGVDLAMEMTGGEMLDECLGSLAPLGRMVVYGVASGDHRSIPVGRLLGGAHTVAGFYLGAYFPQRDLITDLLAEMARFMFEGRLTVSIGGRFSLAQAAEAQRALEARQTTGKLVIVPDAVV